MPIQAATKTVSDVITYVQRAFGDESGAQLQDSDIIRWINSGQLDIVRKNSLNRTTASTPSVVGQEKYSFSGSNIISIEDVTYDGVHLDGISYEIARSTVLKSIDPVSSTNGTPYTWYIYGDSVYLFPAPDEAGNTIELYCVLQPATVTAGSDALSIPDAYFKTLVDYVLSQAYELDDDLESSTAKQASVERDLATLSSDTGNKQFYPVITDVDDYDWWY